MREIIELKAEGETVRKCKGRDVERPENVRERERNDKLKEIL